MLQNFLQRPRRCAVLWTIVLFCCVPAQAQSSSRTIADKVRDDLHWVTVYRRGLQTVTRFAVDNPSLFSQTQRAQPRLLGRAAKEQIWNAWKSFLDYTLALDAMGQSHQEFWKLSSKRDRGLSSLVLYSSFLAQYRHALEFIEITENDPGLDTILNEPVPEIGLPQDTYKAFKFRFLNAKIASEFAMLRALYEFYPEEGYQQAREGIDSDVAAIVRVGKGPGLVLTAKNALDLVKKQSFSAFFPVQTEVSRWMGDTKVWRKGRYLVSADQIERLKKQLKPGDVLLERREWYVSNVGLPGFWPHAALYIGTAAERAAYFDSDPDVQQWVRSNGISSGSFNELLEQKYPQAYQRSLQPLEKVNQARIIEAISEGVTFTSLEHSADADSLAVLRPQLSKREKARAVAKAFFYSGRPYDFNFDFLTDASLVCTELVYKAYEPTAESSGIRFPMVKIAGREVTTANEIARRFDTTYGTDDAQFEFVLFLDGIERKEQAIYRPVSDFRQSWRRPKWHLLVQGTLLDKH